MTRITYKTLINKPKSFTYLRACLCACLHADTPRASRFGKQIDRLVYKSYDPTPEEIAIVDEGGKLLNYKGRLKT